MRLGKIARKYGVARLSPDNKPVIHHIPPKKDKMTAA